MYMSSHVQRRIHMPSISAWISEEVEAELQAVAELLGEDKSSVIRKALTEGLGDLRAGSRSNATRPTSSPPIRPPRWPA